MTCSQKTNSLQSEINALQREIGQLQDSVVSQAVIDQAIGVLLVLGGLLPHQGIEVLMTVSERTGLSVRVIARQLVDCAATERPPEGIRQALETAMADARSV